jgi:hypothetical protein
MDTMNISDMPVWIWPILAIVLLSQAGWIYLDASKRGGNRFLWGFFGLLSFPSSLFVYLLVTRKLVKTKNCPSCGKRIGAKARYCPECGTKQESAAP